MRAVGHWKRLACDLSARSLCLALLLAPSFGAYGLTGQNPLFPLQAQIRKYCAICAGVGGAALVCGALQQGCFAIMGQKLARRLRITLMSAVLSQVGCHMQQAALRGWRGSRHSPLCLPSRPRWLSGAASWLQV